MHEVIVLKRAEKDLATLPKSLQARIMQKITANAVLKDPLDRAKIIIDRKPKTYRFRVGLYRVFFQIDSSALYIERIVRRDQAY